MSYTEWMHPDYEVKIDYVLELKQEVGEYGYIQRALGISKGIFSLFSNINYDTLIAELEECATLSEITAVAVFAFFIESNILKEYANYDIEEYYPSGALDVGFEDGVQHEIYVCINQREQSAGYHKRFICVLTSDEAEIYPLERANKSADE